MSLYVFLTVCVLGMDFLIFVLFQWMYGDKRRAMAKKLAECREAEENKSRPFVVHPRSALTQMRLQKVRERMGGGNLGWRKGSGLGLIRVESTPWV